MASDTAPQILEIGTNEVRIVSMSFADKLDSGSTLTGTPTVSVSPVGPTTDNISVNSSVLTINGRSVAVGKAVQFRVTGGVTAGEEYQFTVLCGTTPSPAETVRGKVRAIGI